MRHFIVEVTYKAPIAQIDAALAEHRAFLQKGYDAGLLLCSGPQEPRVGGVIVARAKSLDALKAFFAADPYLVRALGDYRFVEFSPVKRQAFLEGWAK